MKVILLALAVSLLTMPAIAVVAGSEYSNGVERGIVTFPEDSRISNRVKKFVTQVLENNCSQGVSKFEVRLKGLSLDEIDQGMVDKYYTMAVAAYNRKNEPLGTEPAEFEVTDLAKSNPQVKSLSMYTYGAEDTGFSCL